MAICATNIVQLSCCQVMERDVYSRRQALLQEIDAVREREAALRRLEEASNRLG